MYLSRDEFSDIDIFSGKEEMLWFSNMANSNRNSKDNNDSNSDIEAVHEKLLWRNCNFFVFNQDNEGDEYKHVIKYFDEPLIPTIVNEPNKCDPTPKENVGSTQICKNHMISDY